MRGLVDVLNPFFPLKEGRWLILAFTFTSNIWCQQEQDSTIVSYSDKIALGLDMSTDIDEFIVNSPNVSNFHLVSNNDLKLTLKLNYKFLSLSAGFSPKFLPGNDDDDKKGESSFTEYRFNLFPKRFVQSIFFRRMKGFYVENTNDFVPNWNSAMDPYIQFPDLKSIAWGGYTGYVLNKNFSLRSLLNRQEWQRTSGGSLIPIISYEFTNMTNDFVDGSYGKENMVDLRADLGYYFNWSITQKFNLVLSVRAGIGPKFSKYTLDGVVERNHYFVVEYNTGLQLDYNSDKLYMGIAGSLNGYRYNGESSNNISNNLWQGSFYIAYRIGAQEKLKQLF
ncbi:DUF4421 family protein [Muricauda ruestringensis]|uniref:DUF4421 family protein n=1 Tax=Flagellimonas aurea TaxID=2915619 RepID=A0ABS3G7Q4_9FLAO|nr:DUF4421 family protein [Allomuricauda aurea]MAO17380.1 hypothetical protein [Allomuricauda sp.]MBO0355443.1 DUF4421 family protein [Allomuricauda aurea]|tara:strand:- start:565 stop:1572 length:1008 start_codon:yes stop_codon:yes gene_type:complete